MSGPRIDLNGSWSLCSFDGYGQNLHWRNLPEGLENLPTIEAMVPGSVYADLMRAGWIADVYTDCNTLAAQWVEHLHWFYRRRFDGPDSRTAARWFLVLDGLDLDAVIYLNRERLGEHHNAFRPCRLDVTSKLKPTDNELIVRVESGLLEATDRLGGACNLEVTAATTKRAYLRKPQFACRWDWSPRLMNVGIGKGVYLEGCTTARLDEVVITPELSDDHRTGRLHVRAWVENLTDRKQRVTLHCRAVAQTPQPVGSEPVGPAFQPVIEGQVHLDVPPGTAELRATLEIDQPRLWWPRGHGDPHVYTVDVRLLTGKTELAACRRVTGLRRVELRQPPDPRGGSFFHVVVNGERVFCKGANWVPADLLYATVTPRDTDELVALAAECGCNLLRIWGGGLYESHAFFDACDRLGLLVWHDFMFACSRYPMDDPDFAREVEAEARHNVRALAYHPSLAVWCGNNEVEVGVHDGWISSYTPKLVPCRPLFHTLLADIVRQEDGSRPYWPSSPWSADGAHPNHPRSGDQHPWNVSLGDAKGDYWHYRRDNSRFPNEGGMLGPSTRKTLEQILPPAERHLGSRTWVHHDNPQNTWRGEPLLDHLLRVNLCDHPRRLAFDDYVAYAALLHGEALETGIDNWHRRKFDSAAAIFWMFNDTWPATVSWTPIDYYRRRKPAFWYVKRAFAPLRAIAVEVDGDVAFFVVNDTLQTQSVSLRYGLFALAGGRPIDEECALHCPPNGVTMARRLPLSAWDEAGVTTHGAFAILTTAAGEVATQRLFRARFKDLEWVPADVQCVRTEGNLHLRAERFAWAVCLDPDGERPLADNYVDLIPGIERIIPWPEDLPVPAHVQAVNPSATVIRP